MPADAAHGDSKPREIFRVDLAAGMAQLLAPRQLRRVESGNRADGFVSFAGGTLWCQSGAVSHPRLDASETRAR